MWEKIKRLTDKNFFHVIVIMLIIVILLFFAGVIILKYNVEGETNMPFKLTKISVISSSEGVDKKVEDSRWAFDISQCNDIYVYIEKNSEYDKVEAIKEIIIDNINIEAKNKENVKIYKPDNENEKIIFKNSDNNIANNLCYTGELETDLKNLKISNQGGIIAFRCSNNNVAEYKSNDDTEINHSKLLKKVEISDDSIKIKLSFDLTLRLESMKEYKTSISLDLPVEGLIEEGTASKEFINLEEFIFKRIKN